MYGSLTNKYTLLLSYCHLNDTHCRGSSVAITIFYLFKYVVNNSVSKKILLAEVLIFWLLNYYQVTVAVLTDIAMSC